MNKLKDKYLIVIIISAIIIIFSMTFLWFKLKNNRIKNNEDNINNQVYITIMQNTFDKSTDSVAEWFEKQKTVTIILDGDPIFTSICTSSNNYCTLSTGVTLTSNVAASAGINDIDYDITGSKVKMYSNGRACVVLKATAGEKFSLVKLPRCSTICEDADIIAFGCITD